MALSLAGYDWVQCSCDSRSMLSTTKIYCRQLVAGLCQLIHCRKNITSVRVKNSKAIDLLKAICSNLKCNPIDFEGKEIIEKLSTVQAKRGSFPIEYASSKGFLIIDTFNLPNVHVYIIFCNIAGANAIELGQFEMALDLFKHAIKYIEDKNSNTFRCVKVVIESNIACTQCMMGKNQIGYEAFSKVLRELETMETRDEKCLYYSIEILLNVVRNNLACVQLRLKQVDQAVSTLLKTSIVDMIRPLLHKEGKSSDESACGSSYGPLEKAKSRDKMSEMQLLEEDDQSDDHSDIQQNHPICDHLKLNFARACFLRGKYVVAEEILQSISIGKEFPELNKLVSHLLSVAKSCQGFDKETEVNVCIDVECINKTLTEKTFSPTTFSVIVIVAPFLAHQGERKKAADLLCKAVNAAKDVFGASHFETLCLTETFDELFPIAYPVHSNEIRANSLNDLFTATSKFVATAYKICSPFQYILPTNLEAALQNTSLLHNPVEDDCEFVVRFCLITSCILQTHSDDPAIHPLVSSLSSKLWWESTESLDQGTLTRLCYYDAIAALSFLLDAVLMTESTKSVFLLCMDLLKMIELRSRLNQGEDASHAEFYRDFHGLLSCFLSYKQGLVSGVPILLLTIVTCGRQTTPEDDITTKQPLFKKINFDGKDSLEVEENTEAQSFCVIVVRSSSLLDIGEMRSIHECNLEKIFPNMSPQNRIVIEVVPEISQSLGNLPKAFELLETCLRNSGKATKKDELYSHVYQKGYNLFSGSETTLLSAVLHHQFEFENLVNEVRKSGNKTELLFKTPENGIFTMMSKDEHVTFYLEVLDSEPYRRDVIQNDVTQVVDDVIEKCTFHFGMALNPNNPWLKVDGHGAWLMKVDDEDHDIERVSTDKLKLHEENEQLVREIQEVKEFSDDLQGKVSDLEMRLEVITHHDNVDGVLTTPEPLPSEKPTASQFPTTCRAVPSVSTAQTSWAATNPSDQSCASVMWAGSHLRPNIVLCDQESVQTNSLSVECLNDSEETLRELGSAMFYRERAERKYQKLLHVPQYVENFKKRTASLNSSQSLEEPIQGPSGITQNENLHKDPHIDEVHRDADPLVGSVKTMATNATKNSKPLKKDGCPDPRFRMKEHEFSYTSAKTSGNQDTISTSFKLECQDYDDQTRFRNEFEASDETSLDTLKCDSDNESFSDSHMLPGEPDLQIVSEGNGRSEDAYSEIQSDDFRVSDATREPDHEIRSGEEKEKCRAILKGALNVAKIPATATSSNAILLSDGISSRDSKLPDSQKCFQDDIQPSEPSSKGYSFKMNTISLDIHDGALQLPNKPSLETDGRNVKGISSSTAYDNQSKILSSNISGEFQNQSKPIRSNEKREMKGCDSIIADEPCSLKKQSTEISINSPNLHSIPVKLSDFSFMSEDPTRDNLEKPATKEVLEEFSNSRDDLPEHQRLEASNIVPSQEIHSENRHLEISQDGSEKATSGDGDGRKLSNEELGLDCSFLSRHSTDSTLRKRVLYGALPVVHSFLSLPIFRPDRIKEISVRSKNYGDMTDGAAHLQTVHAEVQQRHEVFIDRNDRNNRGHQDKYRKKGFVKPWSHPTMPSLYRFPEDYRIPPPSGSYAPSNEAEETKDTTSSAKPSVSENVRAESMKPKISEMLAKPIGSGISENTRIEPTKSIASSMPIDPMGSVGTDNISSEPMGDIGTDNISSEPMGAVGTDNIPSKPMGAVVLDNISSKPMGAVGTDNISSEPMGSVGADNISSEPMGAVGKDNISSEPMGSVGTDNISSKPMGAVGGYTSDDEPSATEDGYIKSLEETATRYKATMVDLMREAAKREKEQKKKRELEEIEKKIQLRREKEGDKPDGPLLMVKFPIQESLSDTETSCQHFQRGCDVFFPCCKTYYPCHRCHNSSDQCEETESKASDATLIRCRTCMTEQEVTPESHHCKNCKIKLSEYFCAICKHFTADDKKPYHCEPCGICRIHRDNSFHCDVCNVCLNKRLRGKHKCRPDSGHDECCICLEDAFSGCQVLPCSHKVHRECAVAMLKNNVKTCPICRSPIYQSETTLSKR